MPKQGERGMATDPPVSEAQRRAMWAAASGHSTSGIPQSVGEKFANADPGGKLPARAKKAQDMPKGAISRLRSLLDMFFREEEGEAEHQEGEDSDPPKGRAASVAFVCPDGRTLFVRRADDEVDPHGGKWCWPGGQAEDEEEFEDAARREALEEAGEDCSFDGMRELHKTRTARGWDHVTYVVPVDEPFEPTLSDEHADHRWAHVDDCPEPLHPGVRAAIEDVMKKAHAKDAFEEGKHPRDQTGKFTGHGGVAHHVSNAAAEASSEHRSALAGELKTFREKYPESYRGLMKQPAARELISRIEEAVDVQAGGTGNERGTGRDITRAIGNALSSAPDKLKQKAAASIEAFAEKYPRSWSDLQKHSFLGRALAEIEEATEARPEHRGYDESPATRARHEGRLTEREQAAVNPHVAAREDKPKSIYLLPDSEKYPVKEHVDGEWRYSRGLLLAAAREARMHGRTDLARRADEIRAREFGSEHEAHDTPLAPAKGGWLRQVIRAGSSMPAYTASQRVEPGQLRRGKIANVAGYDDWSPEARRKAAEARKRNASHVENPGHTGQKMVSHMRGGHVVYHGLPRNRAYDAIPIDWSKFRAVGARQRTQLAMDRALPALRLARGDGYAFDRASDRQYDVDGRMHVRDSNLTKANVCPYLGREIPGYEKLGLDPERKYMLLRDPDELKKAVKTANGLPLLDKHRPATADDHPKELTVGATGTEARWESPYIKNSLVVWPEYASRAIEDGSQRELSAGYSYEPDMTPGTYQGVPFDGVMRAIRFNHIALVPEGRAGKDVAVADAMPSVWSRR